MIHLADFSFPTVINGFCLVVFSFPSPLLSLLSLLSLMHGLRLPTFVQIECLHNSEEYTKSCGMVIVPHDDFLV